MLRHRCRSCIRSALSPSWKPEPVAIDAASLRVPPRCMRFATGGCGDTASMPQRRWVLRKLLRVGFLGCCCTTAVAGQRLWWCKEEVSLDETERRMLLKLLKSAELPGDERIRGFEAEVILQSVQMIFGMVSHHVVHRADGRISQKEFVHFLQKAMKKEGQTIDKNTCDLMVCLAYAVDRDGSGEIELREVLSLILLLLAFRKACTPKRRAEVLFAFADVDADGYIDKKELRSWFKSAIALQLVSQQMIMKTLPWRFMARAAFWKLWYAGATHTIQTRMGQDGHLRKDMEGVIDDWCDVLAAEFLKKFDKDGDSRISIEEFEMLEMQLDYSSLQALLASMEGFHMVLMLDSAVAKTSNHQPYHLLVMGVHYFALMLGFHAVNLST
eukprot:gnl/TRDRNA2_/TRDRNA2_177578_c6_seq1.p1 gnl/TRDRNA2_/TRDRNA2_177578_c6~~gnl/TRDRNA2_/TRDRNA2_177578_c6_seq1.p1  ORF type:complete len:401 (+),score=72.55 gnl/TRDRNA2_/TRDRNA2_177578_c6_seq1:51-1205(+)